MARTKNPSREGVPVKRLLNLDAGPSNQKGLDTPVTVGDLIISKNKWPSNKQRISSYSKLDAISTVRSILKHQEEKALFKQGCFGHLFEMPPTKFNSQLIRHLILRQSKDAGENELVFNIEGNRMVFDIKDFGIITGLNCGPLPSTNTTGTGDQACKLLKTYFNGRKICRRDFNILYESKTVQEVNDKVKLSNLYVLLNVINAKQEATQVELEYMAMLDNDEEFQKYPWGKLSYDLTIKNMKSRLSNIDVTGKGIGGFPYAIQVWAYECIPLLKSNGYAAKVARTTPRILNWAAVEYPGWDELEQNVFSNTELKVGRILVLERDRRLPTVDQALNEVRNQIQHLTSEPNIEDVEENIEHSSPTAVNSVLARIEKKIDSLTESVLQLYKIVAQQNNEVPNISKDVNEVHEASENSDSSSESNEVGSDEINGTTTPNSSGEYHEEVQGSPSLKENVSHGLDKEPKNLIQVTPSTDRTLSESPLEASIIDLTSKQFGTNQKEGPSIEDVNVLDRVGVEHEMAEKKNGKCLIIEIESPSPGRRSQRIQNQLEQKQLQTILETHKGMDDSKEENPTSNVEVVEKAPADGPEKKRRRGGNINTQKTSNVRMLRPKRTMKKSSVTSDPYTTKFGSADNNKNEGQSVPSKDQTEQELTSNTNRGDEIMPPSFELLSQPL